MIKPITTEKAVRLIELNNTLLIETYRKDSKDKIKKEFEEKTGLEFKFLKMGRDKHFPDSNIWRWQIDDKFYEIDGDYSSYDAASMNSIRDFYEVRQVEKMTIIWEKI